MKNLEYMTQNGLVGLKFLTSCCCLVKKVSLLLYLGLIAVLKRVLWVNDSFSN